MKILKDIKAFYNKDTDLIDDLPEAVVKLHKLHSRSENPNDPALVNRRIDTGAVMPVPRMAADIVERSEALMPVPKKPTSTPYCPQKEIVKRDKILALWNTDDGEFIGQVPPSSVEYRYKRFVDEYLIDFDHVRAAMACGLCCELETAKKDGDMLRVRLASVIAARTSTLAGRCGIYAEHVLKEIKHIASSNMAVYEPFLTGRCRLAELPYKAQVAIKEVKVKAIFTGKGDERDYIGDEITIKLYDKMDALKVIGGHLGVINTKVEDNKASSSKAPVIILYGDTKTVQILNTEGMSGMAQKKKIKEPEEFIEAEIVKN